MVRRTRDRKEHSRRGYEEQPTALLPVWPSGELPMGVMCSDCKCAAARHGKGIRRLEDLPGDDPGAKVIDGLAHYKCMVAKYRCLNTGKIFSVSSSPAPAGSPYGPRLRQAVKDLYARHKTYAEVVRRLDSEYGVSGFAVSTLISLLGMDGSTETKRTGCGGRKHKAQ